MVNSREIVELIESKILFERNQSVIDAFRILVQDIEKLEDKEMRAMYAEYMQQEKLADRWEELERELATKR